MISIPRPIIVDFLTIPFAQDDRDAIPTIIAALLSIFRLEASRKVDVSQVGMPRQDELLEMLQGVRY